MKTKKAERLTEEQVRDRLASAIKTSGSVRAFAQAHGISHNYVRAVIKGDPMSDRLLAALGLGRVVEFVCLEVKR